MKLRLLLVALPFIAMYSGGTLAAIRPFLFGMPFLFAWNLIWMAGTATVLAIIYCLDSRAEAVSARMQNGGKQ
ncbi:DUF3311 domain-containing protein [Paraburkholderia sp. A1RI-2L]|uniref:DUF3311 domain-containing protein n=1 Tax=Paraburkholderia sp. A1RI-2L TaxID=3028367 RepID=UPI003B80D4BD